MKIEDKLTIARQAITVITDAVDNRNQLSRRKAETRKMIMKADKLIQQDGFTWDGLPESMLKQWEQLFDKGEKIIDRENDPYLY